MSVAQFQQLVDAGKQVGEVIGVERFLVKVRGLQPINVHALILFDDGSKGYVHHVYEDYSIILHLGDNIIPVGTIAVVQHEKLVTRVGKNYLGRVISVLGEPLDGKGPIESDGTWPVFHNAPLLYERELLDTAFETGITVLDIMFSLVRGQRLALVGDGKTGKSSLATQIAINQRSTDIITVYILIGKRRADLIELIDRLEKNNAMEKTIVIASTMFESLVLNYIAPYVAAAMGEYFWQQCNMDTFVVYDDLTNHAMAYREISLIAGVSPGRDSYPGDMFYTHSSLVERAGKLNRNHKSQTILPVIYAPSGDITAYLPTNVMSMTDGQWILDMRVFREVMRPAVNTGLSVTRVGGVAHNKRQKALAMQTGKSLAAYKQAEEYAHFGSELSADSEADLARGKNLFQLFNQIIGETYTLLEQQFLLDIIINLSPDEAIDIPKIKELVKETATKLSNDDDPEKSNYEQLRDELKVQCHLQTGNTSSRKRAQATQEASDKASGSPTEEAVRDDSENDENTEDQDDVGDKEDKGDKKGEEKQSEEKPETDDKEHKDKKPKDGKEKPKHKTKVFGS